MTGTGDGVGALDILVQEARAGSSDAFTRIWEIYAPAVAGYLRARGVQEVDDVTSEVFLSAFRSIGRFDGSADDLRRWLYTLAHHRAVDELRRRRRRVDEVPLAGVDHPHAGAASAESEALDADIAPVLGLLDGLPDDQRDVLVMRVVAGLPTDQVAGVLNRSPAAVRQLKRRALARLRRELRRNGADLSLGSTVRTG